MKFMLFIFLFILILSFDSYAVPSAVKGILDKQMTIITISIPRDCDPNSVEKEKKSSREHWENCRHWGYVRDGRCITPPIVHNIFEDSKLLQYLASKGYVRVEVLDVSNLYTYEIRYKYYYYTDKISPYVIGAYKFGMKGEPPMLICGKRKLKSIDYSNKFNTEMYRMGRVDVWALTFSYQIEVVFPEIELTNPGKIFKGKLQVLKDPSDGEWKIVKSEKQDAGSREFTFK